MNQILTEWYIAWSENPKDASIFTFLDPNDGITEAYYTSQNLTFANKILCPLRNLLGYVNVFSLA